MLAQPWPPEAGSGDEPVDILIVDDRPEDLKAMSVVLGNPSYNIVTARSGAQALRVLLDRDVAVILLDVMMPSMDGFELASLIKQRERTRHTPIIFLTAASPERPRLYRGYSVGAVDYLVKPVDPDVLSAKVAIFVDLFRKDQRLAAQAAALRAAERRERELALAELRVRSERRYRNLAEAIPAIVWTATPAGALDYANQRWFEYTGMTLADASGSGWINALHADDAGRVVRAWQQALESASEHDVECRLRRGSDGAYRWHLCRAVPERDDDGNVVGWIGTYTDTEELRRAIDLRDEFLSVASHELRTPLTALKLRMEALQRSALPDAELRRKIDSAARQTTRFERLIENLLDVSRIRTGHLDIELERFDLRELVLESVDRFREEADLVGSTLSSRASVPVVGSWDRLRLEQVLANLLSNALKYAAGSPVEVTLVPDGERVTLSVRDQGVGIATADLARVFSRFERASERPNSAGGLGLGLFIARRIIEAHGGTIRVESQVGRGTCFSVELPREPAEAQPGGASAATVSSSAPNPKGFLR